MIGLYTRNRPDIACLLSPRERGKGNGCIVSAFRQAALTLPLPCLPVSKPDYSRPMRKHPELDFEKIGQGFHPCFFF